MSTTRSNMLSVKVVLVSTSVLSAAIMLSSTNIAVYAPWIYNGVVSWLRPPYLYLVINCIIITIVASSKLQSTSDDASVPPPITPPLNAKPTVKQQPVKMDFLSLTADYKYEGGVEKGLESDSSDSGGSSKSEYSRPAIVSGADYAMTNKENEYVAVARSMSITAENNDATKFEKPATSARFNHRRNLKASPEDGRIVLGVSKPKKQDTLENTWKTIAEGRAIPISRHLRKSDTWERERQSQQQQENTPPLKTMRKAETFNDRSGGGSGKLRKELSLSHDELNRRVEAFINKFNEDMRLQRQESINHYTKMIKQ